MEKKTQKSFLNETSEPVGSLDIGEDGAGALDGVSGLAAQVEVRDDLRGLPI